MSEEMADGTGSCEGSSYKWTEPCIQFRTGIDRWQNGMSSLHRYFASQDIFTVSFTLHLFRLRERASADNGRKNWFGQCGLLVRPLLSPGICQDTNMVRLDRTESTAFSVVFEDITCGSDIAG